MVDLATKLGIKPEHVLALVGAPAQWSPGPLPPGVVVRRRAGGSLPPGASVAVAFLRSRAQLASQLDALVASLAPEAALWLAWPRRAAGHDSDLTDEVIRAAVLPTGLVDVKVAALGEDWSGLRFVWRLGRRRRSYRSG